MQRKAKEVLVWKRGDGWIQFNPSRNHPCYEEWQKVKEKDEQKNKS